MTGGGQGRGGDPWLPLLLAAGGIVAVAGAAVFTLLLLRTAPIGAPPTAPASPSPTQPPPAASPPPTDTRPASTPTAIPELSTELIASDNFEETKLGPTWRWIRQPPLEGWNLSTRPGWLSLQTNRTALAPGGDGAPILLRWSVEGDFDLVTRLEVAPTENLHGAGIIAHQDEEHYVALSRAYCDTGRLCVGDGAYLESHSAAIGGDPGPLGAAELPVEGPIYLRLRRRANSISGAWSQEGEAWNPVAHAEVELRGLAVGLFVRAGPTGASATPGTFDVLELWKPAGAPTLIASPWAVRAGPGASLDLALLGPIAGPGQRSTQAAAYGIELALEDFQLPTGPTVAMVIYNGDCTESGGAAAAGEIIGNHQAVGVIGPICSKQASGALPILQANRVVAISPSATQPALAQYGPDVFNRVVLHSQQPGSRGGAEANFLNSVQSFYAELEARAEIDLSQLPTRHYAPYGYDATALLLSHIESTLQRGPSQEVMIDRLELLSAVRATSQYPGVTGQIDFEEDGDRRP